MGRPTRKMTKDYKGLRCSDCGHKISHKSYYKVMIDIVTILGKKRTLSLALCRECSTIWDEFCETYVHCQIKEEY